MTCVIAFVAGAAAMAAITAVVAGLLMVFDSRAPRESYMTAAWLRDLTYRLGKQ